MDYIILGLGVVSEVLITRNRITFRAGVVTAQEVELHFYDGQNVHNVKCNFLGSDLFCNGAGVVCEKIGQRWQFYRVTHIASVDA